MTEERLNEVKASKSAWVGEMLREWEHEQNHRCVTGKEKRCVLGQESSAQFCCAKPYLSIVSVMLTTVGVTQRQNAQHPGELVSK